LEQRWERASPPAGLVRVAHDRVAGRVRFRHLGLVAQPDRVRAVEDALAGQSGIVAVRGNALTGSILVEFAPPAAIPEITAAIDAAVAGHAPQRDDQRRPPLRGSSRCIG